MLFDEDPAQEALRLLRFLPHVLGVARTKACCPRTDAPRREPAPC
jgi:hypothetical protein